MRFRYLALLASLSAGFLASAPVAAQSVAEVVQGMYAAYERQAARVNDYTLVQDVMGFQSVNYFEKEVVEGRPIFRLRSTEVPDFSFSMGDEGVGAGDIFLIGEDLIEHGRYAGRETVDGNTVHVIAVDDVAQIDFAQPGAADAPDFSAKTARFFVDADLMVARRIEFTGDAETPQGPAPVTMRLDMQDLRDHEGLIVPHRSVIRVEGLGAVIDEEAVEALRQLEEELAAMPPEQRQMLERMMGPQLEQLRGMVGGQGDGAMTFEVVVSEVRINAGPPRE